jgi:hypothetical protein
MTPQEHYDEAGELANRAAMAANDAAFRSYIARATLHARLAQAGFTRDAAAHRVRQSALSSDVVRSVPSGRPV